MGMDFGSISSLFLSERESQVNCNPAVFANLRKLYAMNLAGAMLIDKAIHSVSFLQSKFQLSILELAI